MIWLFIAWVTLADGRQLEWPASFNTQVECEEFRGNLRTWFDENAALYGIVSAHWEDVCRSQVDPGPLDPQSDPHSH